jgi:hypothetical protein
VSGLTMTQVERQLPQTRDRQTQRRRSVNANFGRLFTERCGTPIWWRKGQVFELEFKA